MRKLLLALGLLTAIGVAAPRPAAADFALSIGLPGFGIFVADPAPPPVVAYAPPPVFYRPVPVAPVVYRPYYRPSYYYGGGYGHGPWCRHGRGKHGHGHRWH